MLVQQNAFNSILNSYIKIVKIFWVNGALLVLIFNLCFSISICFDLFCVYFHKLSLYIKDTGTSFSAFQRQLYRKAFQGIQFLKQVILITQLDCLSASPLQ